MVKALSAWFHIRSNCMALTNAYMKSEMYSRELLPSRFQYPPSFMEFLRSGASTDLYPWVIVETSSDVGRLLFSLANADGRNLIPFASLENGDGDAACFDGNDTTGDPAILMLILDGSNRNYSFANFDEWLQKAKSDASRFKS